MNYVTDAFKCFGLDEAAVFLHSQNVAVVRYALNKNKYLLAPEVQKLRQLLRDFMAKDTRNCLLLELALRTGARAQELLNVQKFDLNPYDQSVLIRGLKGSNDREIPVAADYFQQLHRFSEGQPGNKVFPISYDRLYQIWEVYRPIPKKFHSLRHTFAIELYQRTRDLRLVQVALGHRNIQNTMIYADYLYSVQELKRLIL